MSSQRYGLGATLLGLVMLFGGCGNSSVQEGYARYTNSLFTIEVPSEWEVIDGTRLTAPEFESEMATRTGRPLEEVRESGAGRLEMFAFQAGDSGIPGLWPVTMTVERRPLDHLGGGDKERLVAGIQARIEALGGQVLEADTEREINDISVVKLYFSEPWIAPEVTVHQYFYITADQGWILTLTSIPEASSQAEIVARSFVVK